VPQPVPGILPIERSPRKDRAPLSRPLGSLVVIHPRAEPHRPRLVTARFTDARALDAVAWIPGRLWTPFPRAEARFPFVLDPSSGIDSFRQLHRLRSFSPLTNPFATNPGCPDLAADALVGFFPSRVFSVHASRPRPALGLAGPTHIPKPEGVGIATPETSSLESRVRPPWKAEATQDDLVGSDQPPWGLDRTTSRWPPLLSWPWTAGRARRS
jgi:hypothetical protein